MNNILLIGTANCGKTTLFNTLTGSRYKTVNYPGATVEIAHGQMKIDDDIYQVYDTPGVSSLYPVSPDEEVTLKILCSAENKAAKILCLADVNQLGRHLNLCRQLQMANFSVALILTLNDELNQKGFEIDTARLSKQLNLPVLAIDPRKESAKNNILSIIPKMPPTAESIDIAPFDSASVELLVRENEALAQKVRNQVNETKDLRDWDKWLLHPFWGIISFLVIMFTLFSSIYWLATPFMDLIDNTFTLLMEFLSEVLPNNFISRLFIDGAVGGTGAVLVFLPQIMILFVLMGLLEDSGYLARCAAIIDKPLSKLGLNGKSFVPLLSGFACAIPAMMATRTLSNKKERFATLFIIPLMSCSARLPVYALIIHFFISDRSPWIGGLYLTALYLASILIGAIAAGILAKWVGKSDQGEFLLELPTIRRPQLKVIFVQTIHRTKAYLNRAGPTILVISILLWSLTHMPWDPNKNESIVVQESWAGVIGQTFEPLTETMGLDWRGGIALLSGFAAREVFVSSMALVYQADEPQDEENLDGLIETMQKATFRDGRQVFTPATAMSILVFYLIALQCFPTVAVARKEFGSNKWALGQLGLFLIFGWAFASLTHFLMS